MSSTPHYSAYFREHAPRANLSGEVPRDVYEKRAGPGGPILVGSPQQIIDKLMYERDPQGRPVCTENLIRVDEVAESPKLAQ